MAATTTRRAHATYRGTGDVGAPRLVGLPGVRRQKVLPQQVIEVERYDTDDHRLAGAGIVLAVHRGGEDQPQWRLDLPDGGPDERLRVPLPAGSTGAPTVPGELDELVRGASRERALRPVATVRTVRTTTRIVTGDGRSRESPRVVHDHITLATLGRATGVESWTEVQLWVGDGDEELAAALDARLRESGLRPAEPAVDDRLTRLLWPAPTRSRRRAGRRGSAGAVLVDYLATHLDRLAAEELRVRRDEPDAVHQLRVASRRMRSALQAYRPLLDRERTEPLVDRLREFGRALAPARDAEVLHERISGGLAQLPPELLLGPVQAQVTRHFARVEAEARAAVLSALDGAEYAQLRLALEELVDRPPLTRRAARPARRELPALVARGARKLERAVAVATGGEGDEREEAVHTARKAGKRIRYATEVARPVVNKNAKRFTSALKDFQSALGEHQDTVVARGALRELGALAHAAGENGFSFGILHGRDAARAEAIEEQLPALWSAAWKPRTRRWLR